MIGTCSNCKKKNTEVSKVKSFQLRKKCFDNISKLKVSKDMHLVDVVKTIRWNP